MRNKLEYGKVLVVDLEATCWATPEESKKQKAEIIEIGVVLYNLGTRQVEKSQGIIVKPVHSKVSAFCTSLTSLTQEQVNAGVPLAKAFEILENDFASQKHPWASYGAYDYNMLDRQSAANDLYFPMSDEHINVKILHAMSNRPYRAVGMAAALAARGIPLVGTHHRGIDDALNITKILKSIIEK